MRLKRKAETALEKFLTLRIPKKLYETLKKLSNERETTVSEVAREVLSEGIERISASRIYRETYKYLPIAIEKTIKETLPTFTIEELLALGYLVHQAYARSRHRNFLDLDMLADLVRCTEELTLQTEDKELLNYAYSNFSPFYSIKDYLSFLNEKKEHSETYHCGDYPARSFFNLIENLILFEKKHEIVSSIFAKYAKTLVKIASRGAIYLGHFEHIDILKEKLDNEFFLQQHPFSEEYKHYKINSESSERTGKEFSIGLYARTGIPNCIFIDNTWIEGNFITIQDFLSVLKLAHSKQTDIPRWNKVEGDIFKISIPSKNNENKTVYFEYFGNWNNKVNLHTILTLRLEDFYSLKALLNKFLSLKENDKLLNQAWEINEFLYGKI